MHGVSRKRRFQTFLQSLHFWVEVMVFTHVCVNGIADDTVRPRIDLLAADVVFLIEIQRRDSPVCKQHLNEPGPSGILMD